jgi:two-component system sensor histidine kinase AtoS
VFKDRDDILDSLEEIIAFSYSTEQQFKEMKKVTDQVIEFLPNALWVLDGEKNFFLMNSEAKALSELFHKIDCSKSSYEIEYKDKIYLIKINQSGDYLIVNAIDITEQKRSHRLVSMGQISAHLAHEIRNPIGSIAILASTLFGRVEEKNRLLVMEIKKSIYRVERIIKSTLLFSKGVSINPKLFELKNLQDEIESSFEFYSFSKDIELNIDFLDTTLHGDFDLLSIVVQNFLYNGIDAIEESDDDKGVVDISYSFDENFDYIIVKDTGVPIEDKNILYEPFKTTKLKGHGLGLALSLEIINAHRGRIDLLEDTKGFRVCLRKKH